MQEERESSVINRRGAIVAVAAMFAAFAGKRVYPQKKNPDGEWTFSGVLNSMPAWFQLSVEEGGGFRFMYKGETIEVKAEELWAALKEPAPGTVVFDQAP